MKLEPLYRKDGYDDKESFAPRILTEKDFAGVDVSDEIKRQAILGSACFKDRFEKDSLFPRPECRLADIDMAEELPVHNYTGRCPAQTFEINPVKGCNVGCVYCLADDGIHETIPVVYQNYPEYLRRKLIEHKNEEHFFYYSPKTEAFCEATLQTGIAHDILRTFADHFEKYPGSKARLFIASKSGARALSYKNKGDSIISLFKKLKGKMQFNASLSILPEDALRRIEPYSSSMTDRLEAVRLCRESGITADSVLLQPILITMLTDELLDDLFEKLAGCGIVNFKPEFLTSCVENMALLAQILEKYDKKALKTLFETWFRVSNLDHIKQRGRTAPPRDISLYWIRKMTAAAERYGITASICYWVREQLRIGEDEIPIINRNGYKCLGYQTKLFD